VFSPLVLPFPNARLAVWCNSWLLLFGIRKWINTLGAREAVFFSYLPTGIARKIMDAIHPIASVYFCCDNFFARSSQSVKIEETENRLLEGVDLVLAPAVKICKRLQDKHPNVVLLQHGISENLITAPNLEKQNSPTRAVEARIFGYAGGLHDHLDQNLLVELARSYPQAEIRLIGPEQCDTSSLKAEPNIRLIGQKPHKDLPHLMRQFDVGLIPYKINQYTETVFPVKLTEYLACGLPVISTALPEVIQFELNNPGLVVCAANPQEFIAALRPSRVAEMNKDGKKRQDFAFQNTWEKRIKVIDEEIEECVRRNRKKLDLVQWKKMSQDRPGKTFARLWKLALVVTLIYFCLGTRFFWVGADLLLDSSCFRQNSDAVIVIGGGAGEMGVAGIGYIDKSLRASQLLKNDRAPVMLILSGETLYIEEGRLMRGVALEEGIPENKILLENRGGGTRKMIGRAVEIAREHKWQCVTLVTSPYHMGRALAVWKNEAPEMVVQAEPQRDSLFYNYQNGQKWWQRQRPSFPQIWGIFKEAITRFYYRLRGWM